MTDRSGWFWVRSRTEPQGWGMARLKMRTVEPVSAIRPLPRQVTAVTTGPQPTTTRWVWRAIRAVSEEVEDAKPKPKHLNQRRLDTTITGWLRWCVLASFECGRRKRTHSGHRCLGQWLRYDTQKSSEWQYSVDLVCLGFELIWEVRVSLFPAMNNQLKTYRRDKTLW